MIGDGRLDQLHPGACQRKSFGARMGGKKQEKPLRSQKGGFNATAAGSRTSRRRAHVPVGAALSAC